MSLYSDLRLQVRLPVNGFVLDHPQFGVLNQRPLGGTETDNNLFILDQSQLDREYIGRVGNDATTKWDDVLEYVTSVKIDRGAKATATGSEVEVALCTIEAKGVFLDPNFNQLIKHGAPVRLITSTGTVFFTGVIRNVTTREAKPNASNRDGQVYVTLYVRDSVYNLANVTRNGVTANPFNQRIDDLLSASGLMYNRVGGTKSLAQTDFDGNLVEHLQLATDSDGGYWFIDRNGVIQIVGGDVAASNTPVASFYGRKQADPTVLYYTDAPGSYNSSVTVNKLSIENLTMGVDDSGDPVGVTTKYQFVDDTSIASWGPTSAGIKTNLVNASDVTALGTAVLNANKTPQNIVSSVTWIGTKNVEKAATFEPYQVVTVQRENGYYEEIAQYRIMGIIHEIDGYQWTVTLTLDKL